MKTLIPILTTLILSVVTYLSPAHAASTHSAGQWDDNTIKLFSEIPVLDGGRIKPLDTFAQFKMLRINGKRSYRPLAEDGSSTGSKGKMGPVEWLLDCLYYPEVAKNYPIFIVDDSGVVTTIGLESHDKQRDRYSYNELSSAREELFTRAQKASALERTERNYTQSAILALAEAVLEFEGLIHYLDFARTPFHPENNPLMQKVLDIQDPEIKLTLADVLAKSRDLQKGIVALRTVVDEQGADQFQEQIDAMQEFFLPLDTAQYTARDITIISKSDIENKEWYSPSDMVKVMFDVPFAPEEIAILKSLETTVHQLDNQLAFKQEVQNLHTLTVAQATKRDEYSQIPLERTYYNAQLIYRAQILFIFSFILAALSWLSLNNKWLNRATIVAVVVPLVMLITAITMRCIIRSRPPISTLYETILFITATCVLVALFMEYVNRQKIGISVGTFLGALGLFIASRYEITNQQDTMPSLVAVLDTNFWLATHVTIINIGYAAGMLAAGISHVYIIGRLIGYKKSDPAYYRSITRMVYGVTCFGLLFAFVGTVLGGIWANYSWGRFWGWDPKENGAALICVCQIAILHARMGGYIKQMGIHIAALFTGCVVGFSWWGVNLLGVGLHSYGFTEGIWNATYTFWGVETITMILGFIVLIRDRNTPKSQPEPTMPDDAVPITK
jgi:ABC-type transport system involved in cytochrome c biogenesis permease subunit